MIVTRLTPVSWKSVRIDGGFWGARQETLRTVTLPLEYRLCDETGRLDAYVWDDEGERIPNLWVGDVGKWIEAVAYTIAQYPDNALAGMMDDAIDRMLHGQKVDGYLHCIQTPPDKRYTNLLYEHELYDDGHNIEGAVAHYLSTGEKRFLDAVCRTADHLDATFGAEEEKHHGCDGHEEIELALVKLYRVTGEHRYLQLAKHFIDIRGTEPNYFRLEALARGEDPEHLWPVTHGSTFTALQAHCPVRVQEDAVGHAVRALYLYCGMIDVAVETEDTSLLDACRRLWNSVTQKRMYVTGGVGSTKEGERFTFDYDLPNETAYAETCAAIALVFFAHRMLQVDEDSMYADVMERALYNGVMSGLSLDGTRFFYANPLAVYPAVSSANTANVAVERQPWFGTSCCPPNIARLLASLGQYIYSSDDQTLFVHLYIQGEVVVELAGRTVKLSQKTEYPWDGQIYLTLTPDESGDFTLAVRIPAWCRQADVSVNGVPVSLVPILNKGYAHIRRNWQPGDVVQLNLQMPVERVEAHPNVRMNAGKVALQRGPIVFCLEEVDNGPNLADVLLPADAVLTAEYDPALLGGTVTLRGSTLRRSIDGWEETLYRITPSSREEITFTAIPYCLWANRQPGEMLVWIRSAGT